MNPIGTARRRFNIRFYILAMTFLVFDVEIIFLYPWAVTYTQLEPGSPEFADRVGGFFARAAFTPRMFGVEFDPAVGLSHEQMKTLGETAAVVRFREVQS